MPYDTVVAKTIEYLAVPSVVGFETHFMRFLKNDFKKLGVTVTEHKGALEITGRDPQSSIISAHLDRHGLISRGDGLFGYAAEYMKETKYEHDSSPSIKMLNAIGERFNGEEVFAYDPETGDKLGEGVISDSGPNLIDDDCMFKLYGMPELPEGVPVAYARTAISDGNILKGQIDNVVSLGVIYALFQNGYQGTALLTCEEEIGKSWIHITDWLKLKNLEARNLVIIDTSPYREVAPIEAGLVVLRHRDKNAIFDKNFTKQVEQRLIDKLIPYQFKDEYLAALGIKQNGLGSTELGRIVEKSEDRWSGATIQIPTTEYHTSYETTSRTSIENFYYILQNILVTQPLIEHS